MNELKKQRYQHLSDIDEDEKVIQEIDESDIVENNKINVDKLTKKLENKTSDEKEYYLNNLFIYSVKNNIVISKNIINFYSNIFNTSIKTISKIIFF